MFVVPDNLIGRAWIELRHSGDPVLNLTDSFEKLPAFTVSYAVKPFLHRYFEGDIFGLPSGSGEFLYRLIEFGIVDFDFHTEIVARRP